MSLVVPIVGGIYCNMKLDYLKTLSHYRTLVLNVSTGKLTLNDLWPPSAGLMFQPPVVFVKSEV